MAYIVLAIDKYLNITSYAPDFELLESEGLLVTPLIMDSLDDATELCESYNNEELYGENWKVIEITDENSPVYQSAIKFDKL